jgi:hypothetical protein
VLTRAVEFTGRAQTSAGGWGYVSAKDGGNFDEGSTTVTQVQGLRSCRNAGIKVPKEVVDKAVKYIHDCTHEDGGVQYSSQGGSSRPAITAAAMACLYNAGEYDDKFVPKYRAYCEKNLDGLGTDGFGHWHYAHYYYAQVMYRDGGAKWDKYRDDTTKKILADVKDDGRTAYWDQGFVGPVYTTAINLTILQLDSATLPIYQRCAGARDLGLGTGEMRDLRTESRSEPDLSILVPIPQPLVPSPQSLCTPTPRFPASARRDRRFSTNSRG